MPIQSLPHEVLALIVSQLDDRWVFVSIGKVSKYFREFYNSPHYIGILMSTINLDMDLDLKRYSRRTLERIYLSKSERHLHCEERRLFLDARGTINVISIVNDEVTVEQYLSNIVQMGSECGIVLTLNDKGDLYYWSTDNILFEQPKLIAHKVKKIRDAFTYIDHEDRIYLLKVNSRLLSIELSKNQDLIVEDLLNLNKKGNVLNEDGVIFSSDTIIDAKLDLILLDDGKVKMINDPVSPLTPESRSIIDIKGLDNIIQLSRGDKCILALDDEGRVYYFSEYSETSGYTEVKIIPELTNIIEVHGGLHYSFALDNQGNIFYWEYIHENMSYQNIQMIDSKYNTFLM